MAYDVINAILAVGVNGVHRTWLKGEALGKIRFEEDFEALAIAYKRIKNILARQEISLHRVSEGDLEEESEGELYRAFGRVQPEVTEAARAGDYLRALRLMAGLRASVDRFFDDVMVLTDDARLRHNRLRLLFEISNMFLQIADISEIQESGEAR